MLDAKRSAGVAPEVNLRERVTHTPPPRSNKVAHSDLINLTCVTSPKFPLEKNIESVDGNDD